MTPLETIENHIKTTEAGMWINSTQVVLQCEVWRKERENNFREKKCYCGNPGVLVFDEYICEVCQ